ncbi:MAG: zinc-ribbon domain-containing protein [Bacteroidales bacterium]|nr:zinc-ribbon domain-containing protein [Bacteroidales bacterium]
MAATLDIACPFCSKPFKVPAELVGKVIRCKGCEQKFEVCPPASDSARSAPARSAKPTTPTAPAGNAPIPFKEDPPASPPPPPAPLDDDDDNPNPYGLVQDDSEIPRCPHCAKELDPPDTKICLSCGYDLVGRRRHESKKVYAHTPADWMNHLGPAVGCVVLVLTLLTINILCWNNMNDWLTGSILDAQEKNKTTGKSVFYLSPLCFNLWIGVISAAVMWFAGKFAFIRLVWNFQPPETLKR